MADENRLRELLNFIERAQAEGRTDLVKKAKAAYLAERNGTPSASPAAETAAASAPAEKPMDARKAAAVGLGETALTAITGAVATPVAGLWGLANLITGRGVDESARAVEDLQRTMTYSPRTEPGRQVLGAVSKPFELLSEGADAAGEFTRDLTGSPLAATGVRTTIEGIPDLLGLKGAGKLRPKPGVVSNSPDVNLLRQEGVRVSRMQDDPSVATRWLNQGADTMFGPDSKFLDAQGKDFNRALARRVGVEDVDSFDIATRERLRKQVTDVMDDFAEKHGTPLDEQLLNDLAEIEAEALEVLENAGPVTKRVNGIMDKGGTGRIDGSASQHQRQLINALAADPKLYPYARRLREALDAATERGAPPDASEAIKRARVQYRQLEQIEKAMANNAGPNVSPSRLYNVVDDRKNRGSGLLDIAQAGKRVLPDRTPNSGTPQRIAPFGVIASPWQAAQSALAFASGRGINRRPDAFLMRPEARRMGALGGASASGEAMLVEARRNIEEALGSL